MLREPGWEELVDLIAATASCGIGVPTLAETGIVLRAKVDPGAYGIFRKTDIVAARP